jgi:hypothetical protein
LWPALHVTNDAIPNFSEGKLIDLYDFPPFRDALSELGTVSKSLWIQSVRAAERPYDIRKIFSCINGDISDIQKALFVLEAYQESPLKRVWQNAAGSLCSMQTQYENMAFFREYAREMRSACDQIARTIYQRAVPQVDERSVISRLKNLRICCVPQGANLLGAPTLSWLFFNQTTSGEIPLTEKDLDDLLRNIFSDRYPGLPIARIPQKKLVHLFFKNLQERHLRTSVGQINGVVCVSQAGDAIQDIFSKQLSPSLISLRVSMDPKEFIVFANSLQRKREIAGEAFVIGGTKNHLFRVLLNHKSVTSCFENPLAALNEQKKFAEGFFSTRRSYKEWLEIAYKNKLTKWSVTITPEEAKKVGTVVEFVSSISTKDYTLRGRDLCEERHLPFKFLLHECNTLQKTPVIHIGDTNYFDRESLWQTHFGFLYNPLKDHGTWERVEIDEKDNPCSLRILAADPTLDVFPERLLERSIVEAKRRYDSQQVRKIHKQIDRIKRTFSQVLPLLREYLACRSEIDFVEKTKRLLEAAPVTPIGVIKIPFKGTFELGSYIRETALQFKGLMLKLKTLDPSGCQRIVTSALNPLLRAPDEPAVTLAILMKQGYHPQ